MGKETQKASCLCGAVKVHVAKLPAFVNHCNCSLCRKSDGVWGYYHPADVDVIGETNDYIRRDVADPVVQIHFCKICGVTTHWGLTTAFSERTGRRDRMGVNMSLFTDQQLAGVELRFPDGAAWSGEGEYSYRKDAVIIGGGH